MKHMIKLPAIVLGLMLLLTGTTQKVMAQDEDISLQSFYDELSPYGTWIQDSQYGYVWRPDVDQGEFRPYYTNGRWAMTEYGNTWVSNYNWGWAPFHYGRWVYNRYNQWVWIPDTVWGPAWVSWRTGGGYYGWAPMGPGMNINVNFNIPDLWWVFVPNRNIYYSSFPRYYSRRNVTIIHNTTIINNVYTRNRNHYYTGPRADDIRRYTRSDVPVYTVNRTSRPSRTNVSNNRIDLYTPTRSSRPSANTGPREVVRGEGYATARPDRVSAAGRGEAPDRVQSRGDQGTVNGRPERVATPRDNSQRESGRVTEGTRPQRAERVVQPSKERAEQSARTEQPRQEQRVEQPRQEQPQRQERVQQQPQRTEQPQRVEQPRQEQPQRQERVQQQPQRAEQPQRVEQPRQQRAEPSRPARSSESRSSSGSGRESSSRESRGRG
ncbi:DUF6600 domain-containing protein [Pedobacter psychroterrae]|uniref:YXWGXW repeat-containing protein n=1 Tax=Pedobacter psychroterrae TaxID=2530453 RepID=A0A4R0NPL1_9SPHI|nr:DUF6600 domain-containing protein [Pedobacter psychroterrae]TCD02960.1 hypothetical protein EZ437_02985 [Pedobacter psychroterrae]